MFIKKENETQEVIPAIAEVISVDPIGIHGKVDKLQGIVEVLEEEFNLAGKNFEVTSYSDKGNKILVQFTNDSFKVDFTVTSGEIINNLN